MLLVLLCLPWSLDMIREPVGRLALMLIGAGGVAVLIVLYLLAHPGGAFLLRWRPTRYVAELAAATCSAILTVRVGAMIAGMSLLVHVLAALSAWCFAKSVGSALDVPQALFLLPPVILISAIPISIAGWGLREGAMVAAFAYAGLPEGDGFIVSLLIGVSQFLIGAAGGLVWITSSDRERIGPIDSAAPPVG